MINLKNINKEFHEKRVIKDVNLEIKKGEIFGIIGQSGAGKSTLLRIINGLELATSGEVKYESNLKFGFVFQNFNLVSSLNVYENIKLALINEALSADELNTRVEEVLKLVGLSEFKTSLPSKLSGGQKQRVGIARALVNEVDVLLCDEATSALDPFTANEIITLLNELNQSLNLTIVFVSHQLEIVRDFCDRIAIMADGEVCECSETINIFSKPQSQTSLKLLSKILGFDDIIEHQNPGLITCYSKEEIKLALQSVISRDIPMLGTYQYHTKQGIFAHIFINSDLKEIENIEIRRINE